MKKILLLLLLISNYSFSQVGQSSNPAFTTTILGSIQDASGNTATSGYVEFTLQPNNPSLLYHVSNTGVIAPQSARCSISANGALVSFFFSESSCGIWGNDVITPANTTYNITIAPYDPVLKVVRVTGRIQGAFISGASASLGSLPLIKPQPVIGTVINSSPLVVQTVVPDLPSIRNLGTAQNPFATIFVQNCVTSTGTSCSGSADLASPPPIGTTAPNKGVFDPLQVPNIATIGTNGGSGQQAMLFPDDINNIAADYRADVSNQSELDSVNGVPYWIPSNSQVPVPIIRQGDAIVGASVNITQSCTTGPCSSGPLSLSGMDSGGILHTGTWNVDIFANMISNDKVYSGLGHFGTTTIVTINALATPVALPSTTALSGLLVIRDNTLGGSVVFLIDPNGGSQLLGSSQVTGLAAAQVTYSNGWNVALSSGATPRTLAWSIFGPN